MEIAADRLEDQCEDWRLKVYTFGLTDPSWLTATVQASQNAMSHPTIC